MTFKEYYIIREGWLDKLQVALDVIGFEPTAIPAMNTECLIVDNDLFIPAQVDSRETIHRIRKKTVILYGRALNNLSSE